MGSATTSKPDERFPFLLREALTSKGMSQRQLAKKTGIDATYISRILSGTYNPRWDTALRFALVLGVPLVDFAPEAIRGELSPAAPPPSAPSAPKPRRKKAATP